MAVSTNAGVQAPVASSGGKQKMLFAFIMVTSLFFLWGFIHNLEGILIAHLKRSFRLSYFQASLIDPALYLGYFLMAVPAGLMMKKYGYKTGILVGLALFSTGCFLFIPAANTMMYAFFLGALFIVACGLAMLETAANPYSTILGPPETATQRLNLSQSFNGLAAFLAPLLGGKLILSETTISDKELADMSQSARTAFLHSETASVKLPYMILGIAILVILVIFFFTKLPDIKESEEKEHHSFWHAFRHLHLRWAVLAQLCYVGAQTCILSFLIVYASKVVGISEQEAKNYSAFCGLAFMIGRFAGTFFMRFVAPAKLLALYSAINVLVCLVLIFGKGQVTLYASIACAFFMSIMFPTIFALGIKDIGSDTKAGSSMLIMAIVGGAILPPTLAWVADRTGNFQNGYIVPLIAFAVILYFGIKGHKHTEQATEELVTSN